MDVAEVVQAERVRSIPDELSSIDRRIDYLKGRKEFLVQMLEDWKDMHPQETIEGKKEDESTSTGPSLRPRKRVKKKKKKKKKQQQQKQKGKLEEQQIEGMLVEQEDPEHTPKLKISGKLLEEEEAPAEISPESTITDASLPPLTPRYPDFPEGSDSEDVQAYVEERDRVDELNAPLDNLPTQSSGHKDPATATAVVAPGDKRMLLRVADAVVNRDPNVYCTGFIISCDEVTKKARILTCDYMVSNEDDTKQKAQVRWAYMEDKVFEAELLFFSKHYMIALLEIPLDVPVEIPPFGSYPNYGHEVFALAMDKEFSLMARRGTIARQQECLDLRHHLLFVDYELPDCGAGGPVIDRNGDVVGMSFDFDEGTSAVLSIATALSCVDMWTNFGRIARPLVGMGLKNVNLLDELSGSGSCDFIVDVVDTDSAAWKLGIRERDVITFDGHCYTPLPKFEDFLLTCGLAHLRGAPAEVDFKIEVHPREHFKRSITLRVPFSDVSRVNVVLQQRGSLAHIDSLAIA
ncbi:hypothetical protein ACP70R_041345 [Stipagrostis hirtigluma subsp. patula]